MANAFGGDGMRIIERALGKLANLPAWNVRRGHGTSLTFEFGQPRLFVREPVELPAERSLRVRRLFARRTVHLRGEWHLWIHSGDWSVYDESRLVGDCTTPRRMDRAAAFLDGQKLIDCRIVVRGMRCIFQFDLGGRLETMPLDRSSEQWMLFEPDERVLTVRADERCSHEPANAPPDRIRWQPLGD